MANGPTPQQIQQVQTNLANMQKLNDYVYDHGLAVFGNAYALLSEQDSTDPGLTVGLNLLEAAFRGIGAIGGPPGAFISSFLDGMLSWWASSANTPPSLNATFAKLLMRFEATSVAVDSQLATYYQNVAANWNVQFTYNDQTETLSNLANITIPAETDPAFETLAKAAVVGVDQQLWTMLLQAKYQITYWDVGGPGGLLPGTKDHPPIDFEEGFIAAHPAYRHTWTWHDSDGCGDSNGWYIKEYNIGSAPSLIWDGSLNADACRYLFIDSYDGVVINPDGLFPRKTVFEGLGITQVDHRMPRRAAEKLSVEYVRAMKQGQTLGLLIQREGREQVEKRVIEKAQSDPIFAWDLTRRTRETLEKFLNVKIPDVVAVDVIVENPRSFGLVIPMREATTSQQGT
jgi:hypothetical protein